MPGGEKWRAFEAAGKGPFFDLGADTAGVFSL